MTPTVGENVERTRRAVRLAAELTSTARLCMAQARVRVNAMHGHLATAGVASPQPHTSATGQHRGAQI